MSNGLPKTIEARLKLEGYEELSISELSNIQVRSMVDQRLSALVEAWSYKGSLFITATKMGTVGAHTYQWHSILAYWQKVWEPVTGIPRITKS